MSCLIERNNKGVVTSVLTEQGQPSQVFEQLNSSAFIPSPELAANITANVLKQHKDSPLVFRDQNGKTFESMEDLLIEGERGMITAATTDNNDVFTFNTESGMAQIIADGIQLGFIQDTKITTEDGEVRFKGKGELAYTQKVNASFFVGQLKAESSYNRVISHGDGTLSLGKNFDTILVEEDGKIQSLTLEEAKEKKPLSVQAVLEDLYQNAKKEVKDNNMEVALIKQNMLSLLKNLGFSVTTLEAYRERYNTLYGKEPDIQAIADMANTVVAFAQGQDTLENVSEEVAHVLLELFNEQSSIIEALMEVADTQEYAEHSDYYRNLYSKTLSGTALEERVRKEILGKILAKKLQTSFQEESPLRTIWDKILRYLRSRFSPSIRTAIDRLNERIVNAVQKNDLSQFQYDLSNSEAFFFSAMSTQHKDIQRKLMQSKDIIKQVTKGSRTQSDNQALERITDEKYEKMLEDDLDYDQFEKSVILDMNTIVGIADRKVTNLKRDVDAAVKNKTNLSPETERLSEDVNKSLVPFLQTFTGALNAILETTNNKDKAYTQSIKTIIESIEAIVATNNSMAPKVDMMRTERSDEIFERIYSSPGITPEVKEAERKRFKEGGRDIFGLEKFVGVMSSLSDPILKMIQVITNNIGVAVNNEFSPKVKNILDKVTKGNYKAFEKAIFRKGDHHFISPYNYDLEQRERDEFINNKLAQLTGRDAKEIQAERKAGKSPYGILNNDALFDEYTEAYENEWKASAWNRPMLPAYYAAKKKLHDTLGIGRDAKRILRDISQRRAEIDNKYRTETGNVDRSQYTADDKKDLADLRKEKEQAKSPRFSTGEVKDGLELKLYKDLSAEQKKFFADKGINLEDYKGEIVALQAGQTVDSITEESRIAFDMNLLTYNYIVADKKPAGPSKNLTKRLTELQDKINNTTGEEQERAKQEARDFIQYNSIIGLTDEYYDQILAEESYNYKKAVEKYIDSIDDVNKRSSVETAFALYQKEANKKRDLLRQNRKSNTTLETDVENMSAPTRKQLLKIENEMQRLTRDINLPEEFKGGTGILTEVLINQDFYKMVRESGKTEYEVAMEHMSDSNRIKTESFAAALNGVMFGNRTQLENSEQSKFFIKLIEDKILDQKTMSRQEAYDVAVAEYAKSRMAGYMRQVLPEGFRQTLNDVLNDPMLANDYLKGDKTPPNYLKIQPDYTWSEEVDNNEFRNDDYYKSDYYLQLSDKYLDQQFFDTYGFTKEQFKEAKGDLTKMVPTKNIEQWEYYLTMLEVNKELIANLGETGNINPFLRPQIRQSATEKIRGIGSVSSMKSWGMDLWERSIKFTEDEIEYGDSSRRIVDGENDFTVRSLPKYYVTQIEDPNIISEFTTTAMLTSLYESIKYKEKSKAMSDVTALQSRLANNNYIPRGISSKNRIQKKGQASNIGQKFAEYVNYHFYGIKQSRQMVGKIAGKEVDFTKLLTNIQGYSSFINLGYNLFVDATGATTGVLNRVIDRVVGDYASSESMNWGNTMAAKTVGKHLGQMGELSPTNQLTILFEALDVNNDIRERLQDSGATRTERVVSQTKGGAYFFSKLSNLAIAPSIVFTQLKEYRFHEGDFYNLEQYTTKRLREVPGIDTKTIKNEFKLLFDESLYEHLDFSTGVLTFNEKFKARFPENTQEEYLKYLSRIGGRAKILIQQIDGVISDTDRLAAQRDVLTNTALQHRGWLPLVLYRRFKKGSWNPAIDKWEEGHYLTFGRYITALAGGSFAALRSKDKGLIETIKDINKGLNKDERRNLNRAAVESIALLILMGLGVHGIDFDDEEDLYAEKLAKYIYLRTASEFTTSTMYGLPGVVKETYRSPVPSLKLFELLNPFEWKDRLVGEYKGGVNKGESKAWTEFKRYTPIKRYEQLTNLDYQMQTYRFYNDPTLLWLGSQAEKERREEDDKRDSAEGVKIR